MTIVFANYPLQINALILKNLHYEPLQNVLHILRQMAEVEKVMRK
jgi:hypothetical protein